MDENKKSCPECGCEMENEENLCKNCGFQERDSLKDKDGELPFQNVQNEHKKPIIDFSSFIQDSDEELSYYADGLPEWSLLPPQMVIRKKDRKL